MEKQIIARGLLAGTAAGVAAAVFARIFVEPVTERAIGYEEGVGAAHAALESASGVGGHSHEGDGGGFSRAVQMNLGMGVGVLLFALAIAALFAVVFVVAYGRVGSSSAKVLSLQVAGAMLVSLYVVPVLKYPANPPAVSLDETVRQRTLLFVLMVGLSAALFVAAVALARRWRPRLGAVESTLAAAGSYVAACAVLMLLLPGFDETPGPLTDDTGAIVFPGFPADDLYDFRLTALGTQVVLYATLAVVFGMLASRLLERRREDALAV